ncbi:Methyltransferase type 11 [Macleaya cordata]|uniref:Methyltransferase type 11 n=1 Tax=Macleaya cordata TaxID=56857 RepID=A0A200QM81_MACCD|nr:Methyltransferase type 11 [Macleaya cordata]
MAELFNKQAKEYSQTRPSYPPELFRFIASKTPNHDLAWDVGTGSGQAAVSLAEIYKNIIATDTSQQQLDFATKHSNIRYQQTSTNMSISELERDVAEQATVDLVIVAQALHWFDLTTFYQHVNWVLRKPHGVLAVWCYTVPEVDEDVDAVFQVLYKESAPYWDLARKHVDDKYRSIHFPFEPVEGTDHTGPFEFVTKQMMDLDMYFTYIRSWSAYQTARSKDIELLREEVVDEFKRAWGGNKSTQKEVRYPIYLMMGRVGK